MLGMAVLLLNATMQPLNVISQRRLVVLLSKQRVAFVDNQQEIRAAMAFANRQMPDGVMLVKLLRTIRIPRRVLRPNRRNLLLRDDHTCQCCGHIGTAADLTVDHVIPISKGGSSSNWENLVIACKKCNWRKANKLPREVGLTLRKKPGPLTEEYAHFIFMRYPELKAAYDAMLTAAA